MQSFDFDSDRVLHQISQMETSADEIANLRKRVSSTCDTLRNAWQGEASAAYIKKLEEYMGLLEVNENRIRNDADAYRRRVDEIMTQSAFM